VITALAPVQTDPGLMVKEAAGAAVTAMIPDPEAEQLPDVTVKPMVLLPDVAH
jgi:hypothetical protein